MSPIVVYYSKSGNTKAVAEWIAERLKCELYPVNLMEKKGRGTKKEREKEKELYKKALEKCVEHDLVIIGTPTGFQKAKSMISRFVKDVETRVVALFCTYDNKIGATLIDLENTLSYRGIEVIGSLDLGMLKPGHLTKLEEPKKFQYLEKINDFIELCKKGIQGY
jgi:flavodoxin